MPKLTKEQKEDIDSLHYEPISCTDFVKSCKDCPRYMDDCDGIDEE